MSKTPRAAGPTTVPTPAPADVLEPSPERLVEPAVEPHADRAPPAHPLMARHFSQLVATHGGRGPVGELAAVLATGRLDRAALRDVLDRHAAEREPWFRRQVLDLVLGYVDAALADAGELSPACLADVRALRGALHIADGEFMALRPAELAAVVRGQFERILDDAVVTDTEELYQVDLQAAFGVGYDDYLALGRTAFEAAYAALGAEEARVGTAAGVDDVRRRLAALEPVYRLATAHQRTPGALF